MVQLEYIGNTNISEYLLEESQAKGLTLNNKVKEI